MADQYRAVDLGQILERGILIARKQTDRKERVKFPTQIGQRAERRFQKKCSRTLGPCQPGGNRATQGPTDDDNPLGVHALFFNQIIPSGLRILVGPLLRWLAFAPTIAAIIEK